MAVLNIRKLPEDVHRALRVRAAGNGRSMEAEARAILSEACRPMRPVEEVLAEIRAGLSSAGSGDLRPGLVDGLLAERRRESDEEEAEARAGRLRRRGRATQAAE